ncbi:MAG: glycosyltransferase family 4 protein [Pseudomonadales bacterium]|nr:glycosyltransferase family 4 protein [Pseudomonadales bacterium]
MNQARAIGNGATGARIGVWLPTLRASTGADRFTERLVVALDRRGVRAEIAWLPHRAEYLPWSVKAPKPPAWATIVHVNPWLHRRFIPGQLRCVTTMHSCVHDPALGPYKSKAQALYHRHILFHRERHNIARSDVVTAVSDYTAGICTGIFSCRHIATIYNWIDAGAFLPGSDKRQHEPFRLLFVGGVRLLKGADILPSIMEKLGPGYELHFTGTMEELARFGKLPTNLKPLGRITTSQEMVATYQNSDALLFPTRLEGLPLAALEAMACGLPVVASDTASLPEVVVHGKTGILCQQDDVDGFVSAIRFLKTHPEEKDNMAAHARQRVIDQFSEAAAIDQYIRIYESLTYEGAGK